MNTTKKKIKSVKCVGEQDVHDICVENSHHYITSDGTIHHNTGLVYSASTIVYLSKAKLKTGDEDDLDVGQSGIVVTAKAMKNRLAKPKKVKFEISFNTGCNPFKGLDYFCTPENFNKVGVAQGKMEVDKSTGEMLFKPGGNRWYVKHMDKSVTTKQLFSKSVFTQEVLEALDPIIYDYFSYSSVDEMNDVEEEFLKAQGGFDDDIDVDSMSADDLF